MYRLVFILCLTSFACFGQSYTPIDTNDHAQRAMFKKQFKTSNMVFIEEVKKNYKGDILKEVSQNVQEFTEAFSKEIQEGQFCFDSRFLSKANEILNELKAKNPIIPTTTQILISKNPSLNAYCLPDGTFVLNMGLFYYLQNENQLAGIICHEIGHKLLKHSLKTQIKQIEEKHSSAHKKTIEALKKQKFNRSEAAFALFKSKLYNKSEENKQHEYEADSIGYLLLRNSKFEKIEYIQTLKLMEEYDTIKPRSVSKEIYKKVFDLPTQKFKEDWLKKEDFSSYDYSQYQEKLHLDSISTHPETDQRIKKLQILFKDLNTNQNLVVQPTTEFKTLQNVAEHEQVPNMYFSEDYGAAIYMCLSRIEQQKNEPYYKKWLGKCFSKIYDARKGYKLNRYLDRIEPKEHSESYQQFLSFMWNLKLEEIKNIRDYYLSI